MPKIKKLDLRSMDIIGEQKEKLRQLFPEVFTENKIDFKKLKLALGEAFEVGKERYGMTWPGKADCFKIIQSSSIGTLKPCSKESVNFDTTENLFIEGDNLEVLKLLQKSYYGKVKMIYIDPPYNTGNDFIYPDDYKENLKTYLQYTGQVDVEGKKFSTNTDTEGRFHSKWLNMMYPRLFLAKNLLSDNGIIFISIDDNEATNLKKISDEIFGEENFISIIARVAKTTSFRGNYFAPSKDYLLCYAKNLSFAKPFMDEVDPEQFKKIEVEGERKGERYRDDIAFYLSTLETRPNQRYFIECPDGSKVIPPGTTFPPEPPKEGDGVWRWNLENFNKKKHFIVFKKSNQSPLIDEDGNKANWNLYTKSYLKDKQENGNIPRDFLDKFLNRRGTSELKKLKIPYSFPKPTGLIKHLLKIIGFEDGDIIVDFFAGSSTTAQAVLDLNNENKNNRKFIMVQLPELLDQNVSSQKDGYEFCLSISRPPNVAEIGKERIRRVIKKIEKETDQTLFKNKKMDLGFKVFKLDKSNFKIWDSEKLSLDKKSLEKQLELHIDHIDHKASQDDILYEILLKAGFELTTKIEKIELAGKAVYSIEGGTMLICLEKELSKELIKAMAEKQPSRVICLDRGFANNDQLKTNAVQIMKSKGVDDFRTV